MLSLIPKWHTIKTIGGSKAVAIAGFFPFVGYLVLANSEFAELLVLVIDKSGQEIEFDAVYDRLKDIYLGMLALSFGVILFQVFCPKSISKFQDRYQFLEKELSIATPLRVEAIKNEMNNPWCWEPAFYSNVVASHIEDTKDVQLDNTKIAEMSHPSHVDAGGIKSLKAYQSDEGIPLAQLLSAYFDMQDESNGPVRLIAIVAFAYGYITMAWPSFVVAAKIVSAL